MAKNFDSLSLTKVRNTLSNVLLISATAMIFFAVASSLTRIAVTGVLPIMYFHVGCLSAFLLLFSFRHSLSFAAKTWPICGLFFTAGIFGLHTFGLLGNGIYLLIAASFYSSFILGSRIATGFGIVGGGFILIYMYLATQNIYAFNVEQTTYSLSFSAWLTTFVVYAYTLGLGLFLVQYFFRYLQTLLIEQHNTIHSQSSQIVQSEAILQTVVNHLPYGILWKDTSLRYLGANNTFLAEHGLKHQEALIGKTDYEITTKELADKFSSLDRKIVNSEIAKISYEEQHIDNQGSTLYSQVNKLPLYTKDNQLLGVLTAFHDVTERKLLALSAQHAQQQAELANQAKSLFLANMSHELRTPVNGLLGLIDLSLQTELSPQQREYLTRAEFSAKLLRQLINDVLDLSKIEAGKLDLEEIPFRFVDIMMQINDMFEHQAESRGIVFTSQFTGAMQLDLVGDPTRILQIMMNLCSNAIKFTLQGNVWVTLDIAPEASCAKVTIKVRDTGIGIAPERIDALFEKFTQADDAVTRQFGGTGLGLSIVKELVEGMGGSIEVRSEVGQGAEFMVLLMLAIHHADQIEERPQDKYIDLSKQRILLVEDNLINQQIAASMLQDHGAIVRVADNGQVALDELGCDDFDLVLMDIQMPIMDGCSAIKIIRSETKWHNLPVVALTANVMADDIERYKTMGFSAHLGKPFARHQLIQMVHHCLIK
jgi:PAS domain S-box-containing protein